MNYRNSILLILLVIKSSVFAQSVWTAKSPLPVAELQNAAGFTIGNKGYVVTGVNGSGTGSVKLWEYDQATDTWTNKANFPGAARYDAVAFSIGTKGYVGTGTSVSSGAELNDFWEWDQATNTWTQKANFGGTPRKFAVGFAVNGRGYIGTGWDNTMSLKNDFWEYDPLANTWSQKANFLTARYSASAFVIGNKGYICSGDANGSANFPNDLQEYDPATNAWTAKASLPSSGGVAGAGRSRAFTFSYGSSGFIGAGVYVDTSSGFQPMYCQDFWEYDQLTDTWTSRPDFGGGFRQWTFGFAINGKGYAGSGEYATIVNNDLWEFAPPAPTGLDETALNKAVITLFPNPAMESLSVTTPVAGNYSVYNDLGQLVVTLKLRAGEETKIAVTNFSPGIYFLKSDPDIRIMQKFMVTK